MAVDIIIQKLAPRILAKIHELVGTTIQKKTQGYIEKKANELFIHRYQKNLEKELLERYGSETLYDELCDILIRDNNIEKLIERCYNQ